jgi:glutathione peroxidase
MLRKVLNLLSVLLLGSVLSTPAHAKPEFAMKEKKDCLYCHVRPGEARNFRGLYYASKTFSFENFDELFESKLAGVKPNSMGFDARPTVAGYPNNRKVIPVLNFTLNDIDGKPVNLNKHQGDVLLVVNVASFDMLYTRQYAALQRLYERYKSRGFYVLAFPCNDFGDSEPGSDKKIKDFARTTYEITFPLMGKVSAVGPNQSAFYKYLTGKKASTQYAGDIDGNFTKFLINRKGEVVGRWRSSVDPLSERLTREIDTALAFPREMPAAPPGAP